MTWISDLQPVQLREHLLALHPVLDADEGEHAQHGKDHRIQRSLDALHQFEDVVAVRKAIERQDRADEQEHRCAGEEGCADDRPQPPDRLGKRLGGNRQIA